MKYLQNRPQATGLKKLALTSLNTNECQLFTFYLGHLLFHVTHKTTQLPSELPNTQIISIINRYIKFWILFAGNMFNGTIYVLGIKQAPKFIFSRRKRKLNESRKLLNKFPIIKSCSTAPGIFNKIQWLSRRNIIIIGSTLFIKQLF